jgi:hypothetical protein
MNHSRKTFEEIETEAERIAAGLMKTFKLSREEVSRQVALSLAAAHQWRETMPAPPPPWVARKVVTGWAYDHPRGIRAVATVEPDGVHVVSISRADGGWASQSDTALVLRSFFPGAEGSCVETWRERGQTGMKLVYLSARRTRVLDVPAA